MTHSKAIVARPQLVLQISITTITHQKDFQTIPKARIWHHLMKELDVQIVKVIMICKTCYVYEILQRGTAQGFKHVSP